MKPSPLVHFESGQRLIGPIPLPDGKFFAWFQDPDGNTVGLLSA